MTVGVYFNKQHQDYAEKFKAIGDKSEWIRKHMDADTMYEMGQTIAGHLPTDDKLGIAPNVPRLPEISTYRWNEHLRDSGFDVSN